MHATLLVSLVAVVLTACGNGSVADFDYDEDISGPKGGPDRPRMFTVQTFEDGEFALASHKGHPVVLHFWESW